MLSKVRTTLLYLWSAEMYCSTVPISNFIPLLSKQIKYVSWNKLQDACHLPL